MYINVCIAIIVPCLVTRNNIGLLKNSNALYVTYLESVKL